MLLTYRSQMDPALLGFEFRCSEGQTSTREIQGIHIVEDRVIIALQSITELVKLAKIRGENDDILALVIMLGEVAHYLHHHLYLVRVLL